MARKLSFSRTINADSKQVFNQIARFENYSEFIPGCSKAKLLEKNDDYEIGELTFNFFLKTYSSKIEKYFDRQYNQYRTN